MPHVPKSRGKGEKATTRSQAKAGDDPTAGAPDEIALMRDEMGKMRSIFERLEDCERERAAECFNDSGARREDLFILLVSNIAKRLEILERRERSRVPTENDRDAIRDVPTANDRDAELGLPTADDRETRIEFPSASDRSANQPELVHRDSNGNNSDSANNYNNYGNNNNNGNNLFGNVRLPRGGWLKDPFVSYSGRSDSRNPMKFLRKFERIASYEGISEQDQLYYFGKCLRGAASSWFDVREPSTIREAKAAFRDYYWNEEHQVRLRELIYVGKYSRSESMFSMAEYALDLSRQAKSLEPPLSDKEIIRCLRRHFGTQITREIRPTTVSNMEEFIKRLDEIEQDVKREREKKTRKIINSRSETDGNAYYRS